jgi:hypothetical protein
MFHVKLLRRGGGARPVVRVWRPSGWRRSWRLRAGGRRVRRAGGRRVRRAGGRRVRPAGGRRVRRRSESAALRAAVVAWLLSIQRLFPESSSSRMTGQRETTTKRPLLAWTDGSRVAGRSTRQQDVQLTTAYLERQRRFGPALDRRPPLARDSGWTTCGRGVCKKRPDFDVDAPPHRWQSQAHTGPPSRSSRDRPPAAARPPGGRTTPVADCRLLASPGHRQRGPVWSQARKGWTAASS